MVRPKKKQKVGDSTTYKEEVLFNTDTLSKIISFLPSVDVLNLAITCKRLGSASNKQSLIEDSAHVAIQDIATEEELATLPYYNGENSLANYHYLQFMRGPLTFDQLVGSTEYVNRGDKSCVMHSGQSDWGTVFSNNILRAGKHYVSFVFNNMSDSNFFVGVMRPGQANENAVGAAPIWWEFFQHYSHNVEYNNNSVQCCLYRAIDGNCISSDWSGSDRVSDSPDMETWDGKETMPSDGEIGMLLDLDEGSLSLYKNGRKLGVMKRGLAGPYCWVVSIHEEVQVTIKRGTIPPS